MQTLKFIDLFAGCGGLSLGLSTAGLSGVVAIERDSMAFETLSSNLLNGPIKYRFQWAQNIPRQPMQIQHFLTKHGSEIRKLRGTIDLIAGGPPCQGFSFAGKRVSSDPRNKMLVHYINVVKLVRPKFLLVENVKGIASRHTEEEQSFSEVLIEKLERLGYRCITKIIRAADYCVPQERPRFILIGVDSCQFENLNLQDVLPAYWDAALSVGRNIFLQETGLSGERISCQDALSDIESSKAELVECSDAPHRFQIVYRGPKTQYQLILNGGVHANSMNSMRLAKHAPSTVTRFAWIQKNCRIGVTLSSSELKDVATKKRSQVVLDPNRAAHTLTTLPDDVLHYSEPRILTVREYARLQSFPDWFQFRGKYTTGGDKRTTECPRYTQIGNAVAPFVAQVMGYAVKELHKQLLESVAACRSS